MQTDFYNLQPDTIINAVEYAGYLCNLRVFALNSYENRVYQIGLEDGQTVIGKFYRPERWTEEQILEEHAFTLELDEYEIPGVPPLRSLHDASNSTLITYKGFRFALYPRVGGRAPELSNLNHLERLGAYLGRIHAVSKNGPFIHRPSISVSEFITVPSKFLVQNNFIPCEYITEYKAVIGQITYLSDNILNAVNYRTIRLHGDCHIGNILWTDNGAFFVDFDDSRNGPAVQDVWMLLSGAREEQQHQLSRILEGYTRFCEFNYAEIQLIEALRAMRMIHYAGWLGQRWNDPAFPRAFPWFNTHSWWAEHLAQLREQLIVMQMPPLTPA